MKTLLRGAKRNADGPEAQRLLKTMLPLIQIVHERVPWSAGERSSELGKLYAIGHRFGLPSHFITFSKNNSYEPMVIKFGTRDVDGDHFELWNSRSMVSRMNLSKHFSSVSSMHTLAHKHFLAASAHTHTHTHSLTRTYLLRLVCHMDYAHAHPYFLFTQQRIGRAQEN